LNILELHKLVYLPIPSVGSFSLPSSLHSRSSLTCCFDFVYYGRGRDEVTSEWRKLHNDELNDLNALPSIVCVIKSRRMRWVGNVACMGERRGVFRVLVGKPEGKRPLWRPRHRWEDNIKMDLQEV
jgi:hypothetical protein